jgi:hypothetical protein
MTLTRVSPFLDHLWTRARLLRLTLHGGGDNHVLSESLCQFLSQARARAHYASRRPQSSTSAMSNLDELARQVLLYLLPGSILTDPA